MTTPTIIEAPGNHENSKELASLKKWIRRNTIFSSAEIKDVRQKTKADEMGIDILIALEIFLGSTVIAQLIESIVEWKKATRSEIYITVKSEKTEYTIKASGKVVSKLLGD